MTQSQVNPNTGKYILPIAGDGAITWGSYKEVLVQVNKATAAALTIAAPTAVTDDGLTIEICSSLGAAHVLTSAVDGFNAKGSSGTLTWATSPLGITAKITALDGHWYNRPTTGITAA